VKKVYILAHPEARRRAMAAVAEAAPGDVVEVKAPTRNTAQNSLLHALLQEIAVRVEWAGQLRDTEVWKRLLTAAWLRAEGESLQLLPAVDGKGLDVVYTPTHTLSKAQMASLVDYVTAWAIEQGIDLAEQEQA
jgi:hypothetical protein